MRIWKMRTIRVKWQWVCKLGDHVYILFISSKFPFKSEQQLFLVNIYKITGSFQFLLYPVELYGVSAVYCAPIQFISMECHWNSKLWLSVTHCMIFHATLNRVTQNVSYVHTSQPNIYPWVHIFSHNRVYVNDVFITIFQLKKSIFSTSAFEHIFQRILFSMRYIPIAPRISLTYIRELTAKTK